MTSFFGVPPTTAALWMSGAVAALLLFLLGLAAVNRVLLRMALRNIPRRRAQTVLILFGLMLATLIITASLGVGDTSAYSLQAIQLRQIGGIDEAVTRISSSGTVQGAGTSNADYFSADQAAGVMAAARADHNVAAVAGAIVAPGSMIDVTTGQTSAQNVAVFGVAPDFASVWGPVHSRGGGNLDVKSLDAFDVFLGNSLATRLDAKVGNVIQLYVDGHLTSVTVRGILDTEVNPSIAYHGPVVNSVLMPIDSMRAVIARPEGFNLIFIHNQGTGGLDDLGPSGSVGDEITRRMRAAFTDEQGAIELKAYLTTPVVLSQLQKIHDQASFLDPAQDLSARLLVELHRPGVSDEFKALAGDRFVERLMLQVAAQTATGGTGAQAAQDAIIQRIGALHVDSAAAAQAQALLAEPAVSHALTEYAASLAPSDPTRNAITGLLSEAAQPTLTAKFKTTVADPVFLANLGHLLAAVAPGETARFASIAGAIDLYDFAAYKADAVTFAQQGGLVATGALLAVSFFSISVGILLIFLIFVMLAAERRAEMGMSRAVGLKRRHLTQMFLFEGTAYTLAASVVGVALGVAIGYLMIGVLSSIFSGFYSGLTLEYHVEWTSLVIAFCLGVLLTFVVVAMSAYRVSRLNIVAAIRDLDESEHRDAGLGCMFVSVFTTMWVAVRQLIHGHPLVFAHRLTLGTLGAIATFWWALFRRGPMTILFGLGLVVGGVSLQLEIVYSAGVSLLIIGTGLLLRWVLTAVRLRRVIAARAGFTVAALGLLIYLGRPFGRVEKILHVDGLVQLDKLNGGPEVFALTALMVLLGVIWLIMFNSDLLIRAVMSVTGRAASLAAVSRTSMAYPMATKFRTGMAVAMFAIVTFMIVFMSVFQDVLIQNFAQVDQLAGGWQIVAGSPDANFSQTPQTEFPTNVAALVSSSPAAKELKGVGWEDWSTGVQLHQVRADGTVATGQQVSRGDFTGLHVVDDGYLSTTTFAIAPRAAGYTSDQAVWNAVRDNVGYAVIDASYLDAQNGAPAALSGVKRSDSSFQPIRVQLTGDRTVGTSAAPWTVTIIGFMPHANWNGMYVSTRTALQGGLFAAPSSGAASAQVAGLGSNLRVLGPTGYYFAIKPGVDVNRARLDLGRLLAADQLEPAIVADQLAQQVGGVLTLLKLLTGFLALGLIVGIAGLGVISTRAVVERWQQIGMLRALGYRRSLVQRSFLMESSFIAIIGLVIGALVGIWQSYRFFVTDQTFGTVDFHVPVIEILLILAGAYLATLFTTYLPARSASRVAPADALRYE